MLERKIMKSKKGFTLIELLVVLVIMGVILSIVIGGVIFLVCSIRGCTSVNSAIDNHRAATVERLESNPPIYKIGDIVYHKASDKKMIVAKISTTWNDSKKGWNIFVKDGGNWDAVGGFAINETEVKPTLKEVGR